MSINLYKRKDGRYEARISFGKDSDGKRKYRSVYGKTPEEVKSKMSSLDKREYAITEMTVKEITLEYLDTVKPQLKESTLANYRMKAEKHIIPARGSNNACHNRNRINTIRCPPGQRIFCRNLLQFPPEYAIIPMKPWRFKRR